MVWFLEIKFNFWLQLKIGYNSGSCSKSSFKKIKIITNKELKTHIFRKKTKKY